MIIMKVICSGAPKTGTKSLSAALRILGYNVYDFEEQFFYLGRELKKVVDEGWTTEELRRLFEDVDAVTDVPGCMLWEELLKAFPEAKIVHTERSSEDEWGVSLKKQINGMQAEFVTLILVTFSPTGTRLKHFFDSCIRLFCCGIGHSYWTLHDVNLNLAKLRYREHNTRIRAVVPKDQILFFQFSDGWEPLCQFLGKPIPTKPFPHRNKGGEITKEIIDKSYVFNQIRKEIAITFTVLAILLGFFVLYFW